MTLAPGTRVGAYEIVAPLGAGGMGEVYHAKDTRLGHSAAIKVLPPEFALDDDRRLRFEREARTLATLNHPHIAQIYGLEDLPAVDGAPASFALAMELVEGEDLAQRISRGPVALDEVWPLARQIGTDSFVAVVPPERQGVSPIATERQINVVLNWQAALRPQVPAQ